MDDENKLHRKMNVLDARLKDLERKVDITNELLSSINENICRLGNMTNTIIGIDQDGD